LWWLDNRERSNIMGNDKSKPTGTLHIKSTSTPFKPQASTTASTMDATTPVLETGKAPPDAMTTQSSVSADATAMDGTTAAVHASDATGAIKADTSAATVDGTKPASTTTPTASPRNPVQAETTGDTPTKMEIATEIYIRMKKAKGITRKEIIAAFVVDAKLSKAGASTYYQLIKAKFEEK
jgi:hypothetical protein